MERRCAYHLDPGWCRVARVLHHRDRVLGFHGYTAHERAKVTADMATIRIADIDAGIKSAAIDLCARYRMKLADSLIAATAIRLGIPLVTEDKHFKRLKDEVPVRSI